MKRAGNLYGRICDTDNIRLAFYKASRRKHDRAEIIDFKRYFESNIRTIHDQLVRQKPDLGHYRLFKVHDPKPRVICAASFPERVLHHAVMNMCEPVFESYATYDSFACRKNKGTHRAVSRAKKYAGLHPWFLKMDIRKYFDSIDHDILLSMLSKRFKDKRLMTLFGQILASYHTLPSKGLPIGNLASQHLANFYLSGFDHWIKEDLKISGYVRYMDDFIVFGKDKNSLKSTLEHIRAYLKDNLALSLKDPILLNRCSHGIPFLGFRVSGKRILLLKKSGQRFVSKFRSYEKNFTSGRWTEAALVSHMIPLVGFTKIADADGFRRETIRRFGVLS